ncbi:hypothetical protein CAPTEDRAFT_171747 [Capitella teleta]|uniref:Disease resistance R13L4/SHOC-2-like LRR domain-containing protein n=1 Tax=Capitella teleta TaxID=283909 RepID=R7T8A1_CAPTE|nr:hypothetical protein CAPTEDRAFT_171747 [Capitella teleta]|eukprot:ELT87204.1 hypothetical protein CAPTEDRAFT_171747 [Capitella teleta]
MYSESLIEEFDRVVETNDSVIYLNYSCLEEFPREILDNVAYRHIRRVYAKRNLLKSLPKDIGLLNHLVELYLHSNELTELGEGIGRLANLQSLDVSNNRLTALPRSIGELLSLDRLILSNNSLRSLPAEIGRLQNLAVLEVMNNQLRSLPLEIGSCDHLSRLLLDRNQLQWLPLQLCDMKCLEELSVVANRLLALPFDLGDSSSLKRVYVDNNPYLHALPVGIYAQEIGFNGCGSANFLQDASLTHIPSVVIDHSESISKQMWLSPHLRRIGNQDNRFVPSLTELSLRSVYFHHKQAISTDDVPSSLYVSLTHPICLCHCCQRPIFHEAYPMVFEGQIRLYTLYRVTLCCSWKCVRLAALIVQLPLIYPNPTHLNWAVALVE